MAAKDFRDSREDQVDREGQGFQADFRGYRGEDQEVQGADLAVLKRQRLHRRNSYRK